MNWLWLYSLGRHKGHGKDCFGNEEDIIQPIELIMFIFHIFEYLFTLN